MVGDRPLCADRRRVRYPLEAPPPPRITRADITGLPAIPESVRLTLVLGGARSGKSTHAEQLLTRHDPPWIYIATAEPFDDEMRARIAAHQARRGAGWRTIEALVDLPGAFADAADRPVLLDCLTLWLSNVMLGGHDVDAATDALELSLRQRTTPTILVSNEVGLGIVPATPLGRSFRDRAGQLNQRIAARADRVLFMVAGLPMVVK